MKKCFDITRLLCLSVLLSVFCFSSVLAAAAGEAPALRVALLLEDAAPDQGWNDLLRQGLEQQSTPRAPHIPRREKRPARSARRPASTSRKNRA